MLLGALAVMRLPVLPGAGATIVVLGMGAWLWLKPPRAGWRLLGALAFGFAWATLAAHGALDLRLSPALEGQDLALTVQVTGLPEPRAELTRFDVRVIEGQDQAVDLAGRRLRLSWYGRAPELAAGQRWALTVRLRRPRGVLNPGGFDFERRALERRLAATGYVRDPDRAELLKPASGLDAWRLAMSSRINEGLAGRDSRFVRALALGDTRDLADADWQVLRATGLSHLLAISGFHVGVVAGFAALLGHGLWWLRPGLGLRLPRPQGVALLALLAALAYSAAAGFALPTLRAMLMIAVVLLAKLGRRAQRPEQAFALALLAIVFFDPLAVLGAGFWLSFLGVGWLLWCLPDSNQGGWLRTLLGAQGVATLGLLPLTVWFFGQASVLGPLANLVAIPWITLGVAPLALLGLLAETAHAGLGLWLLKASSLLMQPLWRAMSLVADWPGAQLWLPEVGLVALLMALTGAFWLLLPRGTPGKSLALLLFVPLLWPRIERPEPGEVDLYQLDVGQGLSMLLVTQRHALLYDAGAAFAGGLDLGEAAVLPALQASAIRRLDLLVLSHADNDHAGGAAAVRRAFPDVVVLAPEGAGLGAEPCLGGGDWVWDDVRFGFLHPPRLFPYLKNESSCVLRVEAGGRVALLTGDIGAIIEQRLVREQAEAISADILTVPHHGSRHSSSGAFLDAVDPTVALLSSGHRSRFGHPHPETVGRYRERGIAIEGSAEAGMIRLRLGPDGVSAAQRWRDLRRRFWHEGRFVPDGRE